MPPQMKMTRRDLEGAFHMPLSTVAAHFGVSQTFIKKVCRENGISRWPYRKVPPLSRVCDLSDANGLSFTRAPRATNAPTVLVALSRLTKGVPLQVQAAARRAAEPEKPQVDALPPTPRIPVLTLASLPPRSYPTRPA
jgi:hypothetical protein